MAPLTRCRAGAGRVPNDLMVAYYVQRAGAGLIVSEATSISPTAVGYPDSPGLWTDAQVQGWRKVTDAVHAAGGRIVAQLWHVGRISDPVYLDGALPVAPSAIAPEGHVRLVRPQRPHVVPRALETAEIPGVIEDYRRAAANAKAAGFDGVELHGANGYLPDQFLHTGSNKRTDAYGGSIPNRARFMLEALDALVSVWGPERVGLHLSPSDLNHSMQDDNREALYEYVAREAGKRRIAFIFVREPAGVPSPLRARVRAAFGGPVIANDSLTPELAEEILDKGEAEAVSFGQAYIANPDLDVRIARGAPLNAPDPSTYFLQPGADPVKGYTDYPTLNG